MSEEEEVIQDKKKIYLVSVNYLVTASGLELKRTVQFPAYTDVSVRLNAPMLHKLNQDGLLRLKETYGVEAGEYWKVTLESITPLFIGVMTLDEFNGSALTPTE